MDIFISLIIPVYNVEDYLFQCLNSVINQIEAFDEVIIVNDGSTDHSKEICEKYVSRYKHFKLISQKNQGLSVARNRGINEASGDYIMFLDSDDYLRNDAVKILKEKLKETLFDMILFDADIFFDKTVIKSKKNIYDRSLSGLDGKVMSGEEYFAKAYPENYIVSVCMAIYKSQLIKKEKIFFPEGLYFEDNYFSFAFLEHANKIVYISDKLYCRRYRINSITVSNYSERKFSNHIQIGILIWHEILKRKKSLTQQKEEFLLKYISDYYCMVLDKYHYCKISHIQLGENTENYLKDMIKYYSVLLELLHIERIHENLTLFNQVLTGFYCTNLYVRENLKGEKILIQNIVEKQKHSYYLLLEKIPLNKPGVKVGIYGTGKHTEGLLRIYESLFGKIVCDLYFLDSFKEKGYVWGRKLINYKEIDTSTDLIILSSFLYEQEMLENIRSVIKKISIYRFYDDIKEDIFSGYKAFLSYW